MQQDAAQPARTTLIADFTRSIPPLAPMFKARLGVALTDIAADQQLDLIARVAVSGGGRLDREAGAQWLKPRFGEDIAADRVAVTNGTQSAVLILLEALVGQGGVLLAEDLSWGALKEICRRAHVQVQGLATDEYGILPDAFETACKASRAKALYCNPTDQNPTTAIMPASRRREIAEIARKYGVAIIEDDAIGLVHKDAPPPIAAIAPDVTWYVMGFTKCVGHGLRLAHVVAPSAREHERVFGKAQKLSFWAPNPITAAVASRWIADGSAEEICAAIRSEGVAREQLASSILAGADLVSKHGAMHVWLRLNDGPNRHDFIAALETQGVLVRPAELFAVDDTPVPNAVRLSLSSPPDRSRVQRGLEIIRSQLGLPDLPIA